MVLYKNVKVKVCSPDGDTNYFNVVAGALQGNISPHSCLLSAKTTLLKRL